MWSYFRLKGHVATDVKFFESFNDGNAQNWFYISEDTVNSKTVDNPDGMFLKSIGNTYVKDYCLEFLSGPNERRTFAFTPFIDIVKDEEYWISMDFYVRDTGTVRWFILLNDMEDVVLFLWKTGGEFRLYSYTKNPFKYTQVAVLKPKQWYYLEVYKHGNVYDVTLNNDPATKKTCNINVPTNQPKRKGLRFGDFSVNDQYDQVRIDNVMVRQNLVLPQAKDIDRDNISNAFERDAFCPIFFDDFEYTLAFEEYGWQHVVLNNKDTHDEIWDVRLPVVNNGDPDSGIGFGRPSEISLAKRSRILGTKHGAAYPKDMNVLLKSPIMSMPAYNGPERDAKTTHKLMVYLWTWYDFEDGKDGGRVYIEYWDPTSRRVAHPVTGDSVYQLNQFTIYPQKPGGARGYPSSSIAALGSSSGYSGSSGKWIHQSFLVQQPELNGKLFRLVFKTRTDSQVTSDWGWYIDDVKVYVSMENIAGSHYSNNDRDGDDLPDGDEFYKYGTSPMAADTDWDCIEDGLEVTDGWTWDGGKGQKFGSAYGADPQVRNIFLEIDWLYKDTGWFKWDHKPYKETHDELKEVQKNFKKHDIWFYYEFDDDIDVDDSDDTLSFRDFRRWHATPDAAEPDTSLTPNRRYIWHYTLFAHKSDKDTLTTSVRGTAYRNAYMFVIYRGHISDDQKLSGVLAHELGHNLGLYDYDSSKGYNGAKPSTSTMDYNRDDKSNNDPGYLGKHSNTWYDAKDKQFDSWGAKKWCYGGWQYSSAIRRHRTTGDDSAWTAGLCFASVLYNSPP
jgi:hypothetical protein